MLALSLLGLAARSLGLLFLVSAGGLLLFRSSAGLKRIVWLIGILSVIALPVVWRVSPAAKVPADKIPGYMKTVNQKPIRMAIGQLYEYARPPKPVEQVGASFIEPGPKPVSPISIAFIAWGCLSGFLILRLIGGVAYASRLIKRSKPFDNRRAQSLVFHAGISRPVRILLSEKLSVPAAAGLFHPVVLLPKVAAEWPDDKIKMVLAHELAHIKQNDWIFSFLGQLACAIYPFNPFVWLCAIRFRAEGELAADDQAILMGIEPASYASTLVEIASSARRQPAVVVSMARNARVEGRIRSIMSQTRRRGAVALLPILFAGLATAATCGGISAFRIANPSSAQAMGGGIAFSYDGMGAGWKGPLSVRVVDEDGKPCQGAQLVFQIMAPMGYGVALTEPAAVTDANGKYHLDPSQTRPQHGEPDQFFRAASIVGVMAYLPGHAISLGEELSQKEPQATVRLTGSNTARVHVVDPNGQPAAGIELTATDFIEEHNGEIGIPLPWRSGTFHATTDFRGSAVFRDIPNGYSVRYTVDDDRYLPTSRYHKNPPVSGLTDYPTLHLVAGATVEGNLLLNGKAVAGVWVQVDSGEPFGMRHAISDANGHYRVTRVPYGPCDVHYSEQAFNSSSVPTGWVARQNDGLQLSAGQNLTGIDFNFERGGIVKGTIINENGKPEQLSVSAMSPEFVEFHNGIAGNGSGYYGKGFNADGSYEIHLPAGRFKLRLGISPGPPEQWIDIKEGEVKTVDFQVDIKSRTSTIGGNMCGQEEDD